jgi:hypothetical protein
MLLIMDLVKLLWYLIHVEQTVRNGNSADMIDDSFWCLIHVEQSKWLSFNTNSAIFQLYHNENKLIFNEMMMMSALY